MSLPIVILLFIVGLVLIIKGGDIFVDAASWMAEVSGIPKFIVGATVVSVATTLPELLVSVIATLDGKVDMGIGNAVGSVTANVGLIMAVSIICVPSVAKRSAIAFKGLLMVFSALLLWFFCSSGNLSVVQSVILLCIFVLFVAENILSGKKAMTSNTDEKRKFTGKELVINILKFVFGAVGIVVGADLLVDYGSELARLMGVSEAIIGVTLVAIGTSLPEFVTTITAIAKKESSLSIGNIIGANTLDLTMILPVCSLISGGNLTVAEQSLSLDMPMSAIVCSLAVLPALAFKRFSRIQGVVIMAAYIVYLVILCT